MPLASLKSLLSVDLFFWMLNEVLKLSDYSVFVGFELRSRPNQWMFGSCPSLLFKFLFCAFLLSFLHPAGWRIVKVKFPQPLLSPSSLSLPCYLGTKGWWVLMMMMIQHSSSARRICTVFLLHSPSLEPCHSEHWHLP